METTRELLDAVKRRHGLTSDYQLGKLLNIDRALVSGYMRGARYLAERDAFAVAHALEVEPAAVLALVQLEKARTDEGRKAWRDAVKKLGGLAAALVLSISSGPTLPPGGAGAAVPNVACVLCKIRRAFRWLIISPRPAGVRL